MKFIYIMMEGWNISLSRSLILQYTYPTSKNLSSDANSDAFTIKCSSINSIEFYFLKAALIGDILGDGHLRFHGKSIIENNKKVYKGNARMEFTFSTQNLPYLRHLKDILYKPICTLSEPTPWPNPKTGKVPTQYWFSTRSLPLLTKLHKECYQDIDGKYVKFIPKNIKILLKPIELAHLIMGDGFWDGGGVVICSDCFSYEKVNMLVDTIGINFGLDANVTNRISSNGTKCWRIRIRASSVKELRNIILPFMILEMLYKLGL